MKLCKHSIFLVSLLALSACGKGSPGYGPAGVYINSTSDKVSTGDFQSSQTLAMGTWKGQGVQVQINSSGILLQFLSATGVIISGVILDASNSFQATGTYMMNGTARITHSATYSGQLDSSGTILFLQIVVDDLNISQAFDLQLL